MASLDMSGPYNLNEETVELLVENKIGNYALGYVDKNNTFIVRYVGRVDTANLSKRIKDHIEEYDDCDKFKFSYAKTSKEAFEKECINFHDFGGMEGSLHNSNHPDKPNNTNYKCPVTDCEEE